MSESRFDNSLGFWSGWQRYALALGALIFLFALLFWAFAELNRHNKDIQTGGNNSPFWRIGEVETALLRYINAMDLYRSLDPESSPVAVVDSYEVLLSRVALFQKPETMRAIAEIDGASISLNALYGELINLQPQMELITENGLTAGQVKAIRETMSGYAWEFSGYPREAMQVQEGLIAGVQRKVRNTYNLLAVIFLFIVGTGGIIAFFVFRERSLAIETQNYLATAIETMPDAFALYDADDRLVLSNQRFRQNHGLSLDEAQSGPGFADLLERDLSLAERLHDNAAYFRAAMEERGFELIPGEHPIIPVMLGDAKLATEMADRLLQKGIYVIGFSFPVVPKGQARIRTQMSAGLTREHLDQAIGAFTEVGRDLGVID